MADNNKKFTDKVKEGVSVEEIEKFARKYITEGFLVLSVIIAAISSIFDFFTGAGLSIACASICIIIAFIFPTQVSLYMKKFYGFINRKDKTTQIIIGIVRLVIALFVPFIIFAGTGIFAGLGFFEANKKIPPSSSNKQGETKDSEEH